MLKNPSKLAMGARKGEEGRKQEKVRGRDRRSPCSRVPVSSTCQMRGGYAGRFYLN